MDNEKKINVGILCGGKSAEHEVSLQSARNIFESINRKKYNPILIGINKDGSWLYGSHTLASDIIYHADDPLRICLNTTCSEVFLPVQSEGTLSMLGDPAGSGQAASVKLDVIFPILHGPFGEDGTVQGLLKLADIPFVGSGVLGSAIGMDKDVMKRLLRDAGFLMGKFVIYHEWETVPSFAQISAELGNPVFVKPANMGSSVGVNKVRDEETFIDAVNEAFAYDTKIIIEEFIPGRELECSVLGGSSIEASIPGEIIPTHEFYSYDAKYLDENGAVLSIPADIPSETARQVQKLAIDVFSTLCCEGPGRVDFFLKDDGSIYINEINTMPGFTRISMYPKLWEASGLSYTDLIDRLIELAFERFAKEKKLKISYG